jgi:hypothetical protein
VLNKEVIVTKIDLSEYYTAAQAAEALSRNSGKEVKPFYVRVLARYGILHPLRLNERYNLYPKGEIDAYKVEERGEKAGERFKQRAEMRRKAKRGKKPAAEQSSPATETEPEELTPEWHAWRKQMFAQQLGATS